MTWNSFLSNQHRKLPFERFRHRNGKTVAWKSPPNWRWIFRFWRPKFNSISFVVIDLTCARVTHFLGLPIIPFRSFLLCTMKIDFLFVFLNVSQRIRALIHLNHSVRTLPSDNSEHAVKYIFIVLFSFLELRTCLLYSNIIRTLPALPFYLLLVRVWNGRDE